MPRILAFIALTIVAAGAVLLLDPIPQDPAYHDFADQRAYLGIPNFGNVVSNLALLFVGLWGLAFLGHNGGWTANFAFSVYFLGIVLTGIGSAYYHYSPNNQTMFWDRLPMTIAFMALVSAFIKDRIGRGAGRVALPFLLILGAASLIYWRWSEVAGPGDLQPYFFVQAYAGFGTALLCWLFKGEETHGRYVAYLVVWYGLALGLDRFDDSVDAALFHVGSGHSLKHLAAALAAFMPLLMLRRLVRG